jgi:secreted trypsin-like serine protease
MSLQFFGTKHFCAAELIAPDIAVTTAHCVRDPYFQGVLAAGNRFNLSDWTEPGRVMVRVLNASVYPGWSMSKGEHDIALLKVKPLPTNDTTARLETVRYAAVEDTPSDETGTQSHHPIDNFQLAGWGRYRLDRNETSPVLRQTDMVLMDRDICWRIYFNSNPAVDPQSILCARAKNPFHGGCYGDSGGPLFYSNKGSHRLVGVVSGGNDKCRSTHINPETGLEEFMPTVFTDVSYYKDWMWSVRRQWSDSSQTVSQK